MIKGKGTQDDPLISYRARLMDISLMKTLDKNLEVVIFAEIGDEGDICPLAFEISDVQELIERASELINACR